MQILSLISWYLIISILGWISFPIAYRLLKKLPDKGYSVARPLALLLWGFIYWLMGSYGLLGNDIGSLFLALLILLGISYWLSRGLEKDEIRSWLKEKALLIITIEALFLIAFFSMAFLRANNSVALFTEKPMELAFINALLQSPSMPPHDPWLSGYSISYYYFGYLMVSMLATISSVSGGVAFNLGLALIFAMGALGAYGLAFNLLNIIKKENRRSHVWTALLAPVFVLLLGNVVGFLEILHAKQIFWNIDALGNMRSNFWSWLDIRDLVNPPVGEAVLQPRQYGTGGWWWWRSSRVINDLNFMGFEQELIDEFPAFSFVLGDLHPHVLSIPFVFLAILLTFNLFLGGGERKKGLPILGLQIEWSYLFFATLVLGGLAFLNIWDFPIYLVLFAGAYMFIRSKSSGWSWKRIEDFLNVLIVVGVGGVLLYLPFYIGFSSQAGGFLPNLLNPTRGAQLWVMFGLFLLPIFVYLIRQWIQENLSPRFLKGLLASLGFVGILWGLSIGIAWIYANLLAGTELGNSILSGLGAPDMQSLFTESLKRRVVNLGGGVTLLLLIGLLLGALWPKVKEKKDGRKSKVQLNSDQGKTFLLIMALFGALLVLAPEFVYLRDQFGTRMNTVFKFYMQAWLTFGSVASVILILMISEMRGVGRLLWGVIFGLLIGIGLVFPAYAFTDRYRSVEGQAASLDGASHLSAEEMEAVTWLVDAEIMPLAEAVGNSYSGFARFATHSGQQGVMGWPGHEGQWRGGSVDFFPRVGDIEILYRTPDWNQAKEILEKYQVGYLVVGALENSAYSVNEDKFENNLEIAFENPAVKIYLVP